MTDTEIIWKVRMIQAGQPRPYADSIYESVIELDGITYGNKRPDFGEERVAQASRALVREWAKRKDEDRMWYETYLDKIEKIAPHTWRVRIVQPYCD